MRASGSKSQAVCFHRHAFAVTPLPILLGALLLAVVSSYRYLGLQYCYDMQWHEHFSYVVSKVRRAAALVFRVIRPTGPPHISTIRLLINLMVVPVFSYGFPFWRPTKRQFSTLLSILCGPLRRALHLPVSVDRLALAAECGVLPPSVLYDKAAISFAARASSLPPRHPSAVLFDAPPPRFFLTRLISKVAAEWNVDPAAASRGAIHHAAVHAAISLWRAAGTCSDLLDLRSHSITRPPPYIQHDPLPHLRARLRFNRSSLSASQFRRGLCPISRVHLLV